MSNSNNSKEAFENLKNGKDGKMDEGYLVRILVLAFLALFHFPAAFCQEPTKLYNPDNSKEVIENLKSGKEEKMNKGFVENCIGMRFVKVPAGSFIMGINITNAENDNPPHSVRITKPFYIGNREVTQGQFEKIMGFNPSFFQKENNPDPNMLAAAEKNGSFFENPDQAKNPGFYSELPVENVTWNEAVEFCGKISNFDGRKYRLPSEAEWEYACRAGTSGLYFWGENMDEEYCNYASIFPIRVGRKKPNAWGLYDMLGNVFEWCNDWHVGHGKTPQVDPSGPGSGSLKVYRGGSFDIDIAFNLRCAARFGMAPESKLKDVGFRIVMDE